MTSVLAARLAELQALKERDLYQGTSSFLQWLFRDPLIRLATLRLRRAERPAAERFFDEQGEVLLEVRVLLRDFLELYPHDVVGEQYRCGTAQCDERLARLLELLKGPVSDLDGRGSTPARDALECLRGAFIAHIAAGAPEVTAAEIVRIDERLAELWLGHTSQCWQRAERQRMSACRSLDVLLRWTLAGYRVARRRAPPHRPGRSRARRHHRPHGDHRIGDRRFSSSMPRGRACFAPCYCPREGRIDSGRGRDGSG